MDSSKNPLPFSIRCVSQGIFPWDSTSLFLADPRQISTWISAIRSVEPDPMIQSPPAFSIHLDGTTGPHLGPRQPCSAYQLLPCSRGDSTRESSPLFFTWIQRLTSESPSVVRSSSGPHPMAPELRHHGHCSTPRKGGGSNVLRPCHLFLDSATLGEGGPPPILVLNGSPTTFKSI